MENSSSKDIPYTSGKYFKIFFIFSQKNLIFWEMEPF